MESYLELVREHTIGKTEARAKAADFSIPEPLPLILAGAKDFELALCKLR